MAKKSGGDPESLKTEFFRMGVQYYVAARSSALAHATPIAGNLYHHAIEMLLKGGLVDFTSEKDRRKLGHALKLSWKRFKQQYPKAKLSGFNRTIKTLDQFEEIRYPEKITRDGMYSSISRKRTRKKPVHPLDAKKAVYSIERHDLDGLVIAIFDACSINPSFWIGEYSDHGRHVLHEDNPQGSRW